MKFSRLCYLANVRVASPAKNTNYGQHMHYQGSLSDEDGESPASVHLFDILCLEGGFSPTEKTVE